MKTCFIFFILCIILFSCASPKDFEYREVRNIKLDKFGFDKTSLALDLVYFNPNNFGVDLKKVDADVYIDNKNASLDFFNDSSDAWTNSNS